MERSPLLAKSTDDVGGSSGLVDRNSMIGDQRGQLNSFTVALLPCTALMCVEVTAIVPPRQQALLRTAGCVGVAAYTEVVAQGRSTMHLEYTAPEGEECGPHVPVVLPFTTTEDDPFGARWAVLVVSHDYLVANTPFSALGDLSVHPGVKRVRYVGGDDVVSAGSTAVSDGGWVRGIQSIEMINFDNVDSIRNLFLAQFTSITLLSPPGDDSAPSGSSHLTSINSNTVPLLASSSSSSPQMMSSPPTSINYKNALNSFRNVTSIGNGFMLGCTSLTSLDVAPFSKVTSIGSHFLFGCTALKVVKHMSALGNVTRIGHSYMSQCTLLQEIDLSHFKKITVIEHSFMSRCVTLAAVDLSAFSNVTTIRRNFMSSCRALSSIDITPLSNVTVVGAGFLSECDNVDIVYPVDAVHSNEVLSAALRTRKLKGILSGWVLVGITILSCVLMVLGGTVLAVSYTPRFNVSDGLLPGYILLFVGSMMNVGVVIVRCVLSSMARR